MRQTQFAFRKDSRYRATRCRDIRHGPSCKVSSKSSVQLWCRVNDTQPQEEAGVTLLMPLPPVISCYFVVLSFHTLTFCLNRSASSSSDTASSLAGSRLSALSRSAFLTAFAKVESCRTPSS